MMIAHSIIIFAIIDPSQTPRVTFIFYFMAHTYTYTYTVQIHIYTHIHILYNNTYSYAYTYTYVHRYFLSKKEKEAKRRTGICLYHIAVMNMCLYAYKDSQRRPTAILSLSLVAGSNLFQNLSSKNMIFFSLLSVFCRRRFLFCISSPQPNSQKWSPTWRGGGNNSSLVR